MNISNGLNVKRAQIIVVAFLVISIVLIWQIINKYPEIDISRNEIKNQEAIAENSKDLLKKTKEFADFIKNNKEVISKFDLILPDNERRADLLSGMNDLARANGLDVSKISFEENKKLDNAQGNIVIQEGEMTDSLKKYDFKSAIVKISLRGSYSSFKNFLTAVEKNLRITDIVSVDFSEDSLSKETEAETEIEKIEGIKKIYSYDIGLKAYLYKFLNEENIIQLLGSEKFKNFNIKNLNFIKEKTFGELLLSPDYNINIKADEIGNQDIF